MFNSWLTEYTQRMASRNTHIVASREKHLKNNSISIEEKIGKVIWGHGHAPMQYMSHARQSYHSKLGEEKHQTRDEVVDAQTNQDNFFFFCISVFQKAFKLSS